MGDHEESCMYGWGIAPLIHCHYCDDAIIEEYIEVGDYIYCYQCAICKYCQTPLKKFKYYSQCVCHDCGYLQ